MFDLIFHKADSLKNRLQCCKPADGLNIVMLSLTHSEEWVIPGSVSKDCARWLFPGVLDVYCSWLWVFIMKECVKQTKQKTSSVCFSFIGIIDSFVFCFVLLLPLYFSLLLWKTGQEAGQAMYCEISYFSYTFLSPSIMSFLSFFKTCYAFSHKVDWAMMTCCERALWTSSFINHCLGTHTTHVASR